MSSVVVTVIPVSIDQLGVELPGQQLFRFLLAHEPRNQLQDNLPDRAPRDEERPIKPLGQRSCARLALELLGRADQGAAVPVAEDLTDPDVGPECLSARPFVWVRQVEFEDPVKDIAQRDSIAPVGLAFREPSADGRDRRGVEQDEIAAVEPGPRRLGVDRGLRAIRAPCDPLRRASRPRRGAPAPPGATRPAASPARSASPPRRGRSRPCADPSGPGIRRAPVGRRGNARYPVVSLGSAFRSSATRRRRNGG